MLIPVLHVALGGALGSVLRFTVTLGAARLFGGAFPFGTLAVNVIGSFAMGFCAILAAPYLRPLLMTGILGGFTTFSAFTLDALTLWEREEPGLAAAYVLGSVGLGLAALIAGVMVARMIE